MLIAVDPLNKLLVACVVVAGADDVVAALGAAGAELWAPRPLKRPPEGAALDPAGFAPNNDGVVVDVGAGAVVAAGVG